MGFWGDNHKRMDMTRTEQERAIKKVEIAINKMVDLQDMGQGDAQVTRILEMLNSLESDFRTRNYS